MSHTGVIDPGSDFVTGAYTITRSDAETWALGRATADASPTVIAGVPMSIQPVTGRALRAMPEGAHASETRVAYSQTELRARPPGASSGGDQVTIDAETWICTKVSRWQAFGETHYVAYLERQGVTG